MGTTTGGSIRSSAGFRYSAVYMAGSYRHYIGIITTAVAGMKNRFRSRIIGLRRCRSGAGFSAGPYLRDGKVQIFEHGSQAIRLVCGQEPSWQQRRRKKNEQRKIRKRRRKHVECTRNGVETHREKTTVHHENNLRSAVSPPPEKRGFTTA